jgi:hypothetical protein
MALVYRQKITTENKNNGSELECNAFTAFGSEQISIVTTAGIRFAAPF